MNCGEGGGNRSLSNGKGYKKDKGSIGGEDICATKDLNTEVGLGQDV